MNYQNVLCIGDSQTFGARTYGCYPLHLARVLTATTPYLWRTINESHNGHTARDLWFDLPGVLQRAPDTHQACVLIGTNDVGEGTPIDLFEEYYRQTLRALRIAGFRAVFCGEIPPIFADGHVYFPKETAARHDEYNAALRRALQEHPGAVHVGLGSLTRDAYVDPVHFNESGNELVAEAFADAIREQ
ncbi:MAG: SGNH/GDSL hydrolase family protein [Actinomycetota bacterium]